MNHFSVNGIRREFPIEQLTDEKPFQDLLSYIRKTYSGEKALISSIVVNGVELDASDEPILDRVPISQIRSLEIFTRHPREMAEETLQILMKFTEHLQLRCLDLASSGARELSVLVEGVGTFNEALTSTKQILRISKHPVTDVLEADLASILRDVLKYSQLGNYEYVAELLNQHLAPCLQQWREDGIPALIRARDS